jgi:hypothetical protein
VGVWQFNVGEENKARLEHDLIAERDKVEFRRKLWLQQVESYRATAELAGKISAHTQDDKLPELARDFVAAYWGTMILVEDPAVERAMVQFYVELTDLKAGWSNERRIKLRADTLIKEFRRSEANPPH